MSADGSGAPCMETIDGFRQSDRTVQTGHPNGMWGGQSLSIAAFEGSVRFVGVRCPLARNSMQYVQSAAIWRRLTPIEETEPLGREGQAGAFLVEPTNLWENGRWSWASQQMANGHGIGRVGRRFRVDIGMRGK